MTAAPALPVLLLPGPQSLEAARALIGEVYEYQTYLADDYRATSAPVLANGELAVFAGRRVDVWEAPARFRSSEFAIEPVLRTLLKHGCHVRVIAVTEDDEQYEPYTAKVLGWTRTQLLDWARQRIKPIESLPDLPVKRLRRGKPRSTEVGPAGGGIEFDAQGASVFISWEQLGLTSFDGKPPAANLDTIQKIIGHHPELAGKIWFDEFHGKVFQVLFQAEPAEWADHHDTRLAVWIQRQLRLPKIGHQLVQRAVDDYARLFTRNEVRDWMDSLEWDKVERLPTLLSRGFGAEQNDYSAAVGRCWMVSMVARTYEPGCKVDTMPVFEGAQGLRKSTALSVIGGPWFSEMHEDITTKDFKQNLPGKLLIEISELHAFRRAEINRIKGIISDPCDRYRASYGRRAEDHPRRGVWAGTTNRDDWNEDDTGARRFWPIACGPVDLQWLRDHRQQLFAEAVHRYREGESWWDIDPDLAKAEQDARREDDVWADTILGHIEGRAYTFIRDILCGALGMKLEDIEKRDELRVASVLRLNGWKRRQQWIGGRNVKAWFLCKSVQNRSDAPDMFGP